MTTGQGAHPVMGQSQTGTPTLELNICFPWSAQTAHGSAILKWGALQIKTDQFCSTILNETLLFWKEFH